MTLPLLCNRLSSVAVAVIRRGLNMHWNAVALVVYLWGAYCGAFPNSKDESLRTLLQNYQQNQDLITNLGTRYEVVYPVQIRQDWIRGLSTKVSTVNDSVEHLQKTSFVIDSVEHKLYFDLELNTNLLAPTLVQFLYLHDSHMTIGKLPENCYYHATVRNHPEAKAAFQTCYGLSGVIYMEEKIFIIYPLYGSSSVNHPHLLYHYFPEDVFTCDNDYSANILQEHTVIHSVENAPSGNKFIELALVIDQSLFELKNSSPKDVIASSVQVINCVDLLYRSLNTSISLVYLELWIKNQIKIESSIRKSLNNFQVYSSRNLRRITVDASHMLSAFEFNDNRNGLAISDSICTAEAVGLVKVNNPFQPHLTSYVLAHMIGHNLGMEHKNSKCNCNLESGCIMANNVKLLSAVHFSTCSINDYYKTLNRGYGACLFNMPTMRMSICGNGILEKEEECDCGTSDECVKSDTCCDPMTCKLIKHAQCSSGPCCKKCKLLSPDHLCRPSKGECDIPEFCDGKTGQCPADLYKRNGIICGGGLGYCYQGTCPVMKQQCQDIWGESAESADTICFERVNVLGTPNGNCGSDSKGGVIKCSTENSHCGSLQCRYGEKVPISGEKPIQFVVIKFNHQGTIHECKAKSSSFLIRDTNYGLVKEGTKCGYQKFCVNQTCTHVKNLSSGSCPSKGSRVVCSGKGVCTNINTCYCDEGWEGAVCSEVDKESQFRKDEYGDYYDSDSNMKNLELAENEMKMNANLAVTVTAACVVTGLGLVTAVILILLYSKNMLGERCSRKYRYK